MNDSEPVNLLRPTQPNLPPEPQKKRPAFYFFVAVILIFLGAWLVRRTSLQSWPADPLAYDPVTLHPTRIGFFESVKNLIFHSGNVLEGQTGDRVNILLLGIGGVGHDGPFLTDTNILLSIKPSTKQVALISIPRDLGVDIPDHGWRKINSADAFGEADNSGQGGEYARDIFAKTFDIDIPYYIRVDFQAFQELIDTVGGVTIQVPKTFTDHEFPGPNFSYQTVNFTAGTEHMDGARALTFARSRHGDNGEGSDFARSRRQELVLQALRAQLLSLGTYSNPAKIQNILDILSSHVKTNLDFGQMMFLASMAKDFGENSVKLVLDSSPNGYLINTTGENGAFMLAPKTGNFDGVNSAIKNIFEDTTASMQTAASATNKNVKQIGLRVEVQNGTWRAGLASRIKSKLSTEGFDVVSVGNSLLRPIDKTAIYIINGKADLTATDKLTKLLGADKNSVLPDWLAENYDNPKTIDDERGMKYDKETDALVILGNDIKE